ncbi:hypothetical protein RAS1_05980 [Phycisphaerae bacterium RAS1]|nr:hypothetical protein RAS1_05980 [Phycisphaerae bacterium RAS1]
MGGRILPALLILLLVGCPTVPTGDDNGANGNDNTNGNSNANVNDNGSGSNDDSAVLPIVSPTQDKAPGLTPDVAKPKTPPPPSAVGASALLNEVRFNPAGDDAAFIELKAAPGAELSGLVVANENADSLELPVGASAGPTGFYLILFDGQSDGPPGELHLSAASFLNPTSGRITLSDAAGDRLDDVAWGAQQPDAVAADSGGGLGNEIELPGQVIARPPESLLPGPQNWSAYPPTWATPGASNPNAGVSVLLPMSGFIEEAGPVVLACYPTANALEYRFQVAVEPAFESPAEDITIDQPSVTVMLEVGTYFWRVAPVAADGSTADFSPANRLIVEAQVDTEATPDDGAAKPLRRSQVAGKLVTRTLDARSPGGRFPSESQRKDSHMLLLESNREDEGFEWDRPHPVFHLADFADNLNCTLAAVKMVNHYYGGDLTQDRTGYELHKDDAPGPETDLNYGEGNTPDRPLAWALGGARVNPVYGAGARVELPPSTLWKNVEDAIDGGRPVVVAVTRRAGGTHTVVIIGYQVDARRPGVEPIHRFLVNDPGNEGQAAAKRSFVEFSEFYWQVYAYYLLDAGSHAGRKQEAGIGVDTDQDQVYDFDEDMRFRTKRQPNAPASRDTDGDCISDYNEIKLSVLDERHGVGVYRTTLHGDGRARARNAPELTLDTDGGGLSDFVEDLNQNGKIEPDKGESDPYDSADDRRKIVGTIRSYLERDEQPFRLYYRHIDDDFDLQTGTNRKLTGSWKIMIESQSVVSSGPAPPQCPEPRQITYVYAPLDREAMNFEGEFTCNVGGPPGIVIREKEPFYRHHSDSEIDDPCLGPNHGTDVMGWAPLVARSVHSPNMAEFITARNRVQWKYRIAPSSTLPIEHGSYLEVDFTMTPR